MFRPQSLRVVFGMALLAALVLPGTASAATTVPLGTADSFAVLAGSGVTNTGPSVVNGDLGSSPTGTITGFPPGTVQNGTIHAGDAVAAQAQNDLTAAYNNAAGQPCNVDRTGQNLGGGLTLTSGVYCYPATSAQLTGALTLNGQGDAASVFIFQIGTALTTASNSSVSLINGAQACNVFWQIGSSATLGTTTHFVGNILALSSITATTSATVAGRLLARNGAVTLDTNTITRARCAGSTGGGGGSTGIPGPTVTITGVPKETADNFRLRVTATDAVGVSQTDVFLDGKLVKSVVQTSFTSKASFRVRIKARRLKPGRHRIRVVSRSTAGSETVKKTSFRRSATRTRGNSDFTGINFTG
jgi:ice-binding like protein/Big-like domain-containing protein